MSMYVIQRALDNKYLSFSDDGDTVWNEDVGHFETDMHRALAWATNYGGHIVELIEAPAKVVVSEEEAEMLERAKNKLFQEAGVIYHYVKDHGGWQLGNDLGDRLMRAYVNGWTVEKPKRFVLPMEETKKPLYAWKKNGHWDVAVFYGEYISDDPIVVTQSDLDAAPAWVKAIAPVEVKD